jgi:hypothetical protein
MKPTTADYLQLSIYPFHKNGTFKLEQSIGTITFPKNPNIQPLHFSITLKGNCLCFTSPIKQWIYFITTPCNYGGQRYWFKCGLCKKRRAVLYYSHQHEGFYCRECLGLGYESQNASKWYLTWHRAIEKLERPDFSRRTKYYKGRWTKAYSRYIYQTLKGINQVNKFLRATEGK